MPAPATVPDRDVDERAAELLRALAGPDATFRSGQLDAIRAAVVERGRVLVVQRTGWGKSAVYFVATKLLREAGAGPTLLVSPLLALMRNQLAAAERMGVRAATINSTNVDDWDAVFDDIAADRLDLICISPERLNNPSFRARALRKLAGGIGMLVVDEAHCISDWGHDFRPDYRRLRDVVARLGPGVPVLATTATANQRVSDDVAAQLGEEATVIRGELARDSLALAVVDGLDAAERLAWLAANLPRLPGSGIVYCLTIADCERLATYLQGEGVDAHAYSSETPPDERERLEQALLDGTVKALVATSSLGMGFDKPDLGFVAHHGMPSSPIAYYQQVGRAGRALDDAVAVLLPGREDRRIWEYFDSVAYPSRPQAEAVVACVARAGGEPVSLAAIESAVDIRRGRLEAMVKILDVDGAFERVAGGVRRTDEPWEYDEGRRDAVRAARRREADAMVAYASTEGCRMAYLREQLDDPGAAPCGRCDRCAPVDVAARFVAPSDEQVAAARAALRSADVVIEPRRRWPTGLDEPKGNIKPGDRVEEGRALAWAGDGGWSAEVDAWLERGGPAPDDLVAGVAAVLKRWRWDSRPTWVTWVPGARQAELAHLASRLGDLGGLAVHDVVRRTRRGRPQDEVRNAAHLCANVWGAFAIEAPPGGLPSGPVLLLDDVRRSGWTLTVVGAELRRAGASAVLPFTLLRAQ